MPEEEARTYLKKCVDSGLWIPNAQDAQAHAEEAEPESEHYEAVGEEAKQFDDLSSKAHNNKIVGFANCLSKKKKKQKRYGKLYQKIML